MINEMLEFSQQVVYKTRTEGSYVNGFFIEGVETIDVVDAIVQPLKEEELKFAPEGFRVDNSIKVKTDIALQLQAVIEVDSKEYRIIRGKNHRNIFEHYIYQCLEVNS